MHKASTVSISVYSQILTYKYCWVNWDNVEWTWTGLWFNWMFTEISIAKNSWVFIVRWCIDGYRASLSITRSMHTSAANSRAAWILLASTNWNPTPTLSGNVLHVSWIQSATRYSGEGRMSCPVVECTRCDLCRICVIVRLESLIITWCCLQCFANCRRTCKRKLLKHNTGVVCLPRSRPKRCPL